LTKIAAMTIEIYFIGMIEQIIQTKKNKMKTIEEASLENSKLHYIQAFSEELHKDADMDFRKGVEFAQQWISVSDELPEQYEEVLIKNNTKSYIGYLMGSNFFLNTMVKNYSVIINDVTHWRKIQLK